MKIKWIWWKHSLASILLVDLFEIWMELQHISSKWVGTKPLAQRGFSVKAERFIILAKGEGFYTRLDPMDQTLSLPSCVFVGVSVCCTVQLTPGFCRSQQYCWTWSRHSSIQHTHTHQGQNCTRNKPPLVDSVEGRLRIVQSNRWDTIHKQTDLIGRHNKMASCKGFTPMFSPIWPHPQAHSPSLYNSYKPSESWHMLCPRNIFKLLHHRAA